MSKIVLFPACFEGLLFRAQDGLGFRRVSDEARHDERAGKNDLDILTIGKGPKDIPPHCRNSYGRDSVLRQLHRSIPLELKIRHCTERLQSDTSYPSQHCTKVHICTFQTQPAVACNLKHAPQLPFELPHRLNLAHQEHSFMAFEPHLEAARAQLAVGELAKFQDCSCSNMLQPFLSSSNSRIPPKSSHRKFRRDLGQMQDS